MGKVKKSKSTASARNVGLAEQILDDGSVRTKMRQKVRKDRKDDAEEFVGDKITEKILAQARMQQAELNEKHGGSGEASTQKRVSLGATQGDSSDEQFSEDDGDYEDIELAEEDEEAMKMFMSTNQTAKRTLHDIIRETLTEKKTEIDAQMADGGSVCMESLDEPVQKMYEQVKTILARYRSGKLPKAFKAIPSLRNWEQVLDITGPENWSAAAVYQATRIFASNFNGKMAQRFYNLVLLPRVRDDIAEFKRLNFHLYMALKKALFKPAAFFKGILLPLCEGDCTLREAHIIGSVLTKCSIPMLHSAAAILKISEAEYYGANSMFLRVLLDKKYAMPYRVTDAVVDHFIRFQRDPREAPVLWHQSLLTFVQRYKQDLSSEQKAALMETIRVKSHPGITPEIRRELVHSKCRDVEMAEPAMDTDF